MNTTEILLSQFADVIAKTLVRRTVRTLCGMRDGLQSGDDSPLLNLWDEICVQVQGQLSVLWDAYEDTIIDIIRRHVSRLKRHELGALWLQTDQGFDWCCDQDESSEQDEGSGHPPVCLDDIVEHVLRGVLGAAADWENRRIAAAKERSYLD